MSNALAAHRARVTTNRDQTVAEQLERAPQNVGPNERLVSALAGGGLLAAGLLRGSWKGLGLALLGGSLVYRGLSGHCSLYQALGINQAGFDNPAVGVPAQRGVRFETCIVIDRPPEQIYRFWRKLENLPQVMQHLESVHEESNQRSHWVATGPMGTRIEWDAEIVNDQPGELIAWRSIPGSALDTAGSVHFAHAGTRGTELKVTLKYDPPLGKLGATLANLFGGSFEQKAQDDLERFKQTMEISELPPALGAAIAANQF